MVDLSQEYSAFCSYFQEFLALTELFKTIRMF